MGRLRARLARTSVDAVVQSHVAAAQAQMQMALRECRRARSRHEIDTGRAIRVERDIGRALAALGNVGRTSPLREVSDPDLMPERDREERWREDMLRRREEEETAAAAAEEAEAMEVPEPEPEPEAEVSDG